MVQAWQHQRHDPVCKSHGRLSPHILRRARQRSGELGQFGNDKRSVRKGNYSTYSMDIFPVQVRMHAALIEYE